MPFGCQLGIPPSNYEQANVNERIAASKASFMALILVSVLTSLWALVGF